MDSMTANVQQILAEDRRRAQSLPTGISAEMLSETATSIHRRIVERFPQANLRNLAASVAIKVENVADAAKRDFAPRWFITLVLFLLVTAVLSAAGWGLYRMGLHFGSPDWTELVQSADAALQMILVIGVAVWSLLSLGHKLQRSRQLAYLESLREFIHLLDLHQLEKDPDRLSRRPDENTSSSPKMEHVSTAFLMGRYLDYVSELLAVVATMAAYYAANARDEVVLGVVREIGASASQHRLHIGQKAAILAQLELKESVSAPVQEAPIPQGVEPQA